MALEVQPKEIGILSHQCIHIAFFLLSLWIFNWWRFFKFTFHPFLLSFWISLEHFCLFSSAHYIHLFVPTLVLKLDNIMSVRTSLSSAICLLILHFKFQTHGMNCNGLFRTPWEGRIWGFLEFAFQVHSSHSTFILSVRLISLVECQPTN